LIYRSGIHNGKEKKRKEKKRKEKNEGIKR
jgi:hypothetical protein